MSLLHMTTQTSKQTNTLTLNQESNLHLLKPQRLSAFVNLSIIFPDSNGFVQIMLQNHGIKLMSLSTLFVSHMILMMKQNISYMDKSIWIPQTSRLLDVHLLLPCNIIMLTITAQFRPVCPTTFFMSRRASEAGIG